MYAIHTGYGFFYIIFFCIFLLSLLYVILMPENRILSSFPSKMLLEAKKLQQE